MQELLLRYIRAGEVMYVVDQQHVQIMVKVLEMLNVLVVFSLHQRHQVTHEVVCPNIAICFSGNRRIISCGSLHQMGFPVSDVAI